MALRTGNPTLNERTFARFGPAAATGDAMTIEGTVNRTALLLLLVAITATWTWSKTFAGVETGGYLLVGALGGFVVALVTVFKPTWAPVTAPVYALLEGLALGALSAIFEARYPGIVIQAVALTFGTLLALLAVYRSGLIRATENFKLGVVAATGGIALIYLATILLRVFGINMPYIHDSGWIGIGFSLFVIIVAALNFVLDFDFIEQGAANGAPKVAEWYGAFGLMVTLIWLYIEILRLLGKLRRR